MNKLVKRFFSVSHDYHDSPQTVRARVLMPLNSAIAFLALLFGLYIELDALAGFDTPISELQGAPVLALFLIGWAGVVLWLTYKDKVSEAALSVSVLLITAAAFGLIAGGIAPSPILTLPAILIYLGLAYGSRGTIIGAIFAWITLPLTAYLQSKGLLRVDEKPLKDLLYEAVISVHLITLSAVLLWIFAWNLQRALLRANRIATQTRAIAESGQVISQILNMDELLTRTVDLIRDRFAFYHVQIFMLDESKAYADLSASTGKIGQALLAQGFRVQVGSRSPVGEAASGTVCLVPDLAVTSYRRPELLSDMRTELAIPLLSGENIIGVLDAHSLRPNAFGPEEVETMRVMANQISQAVQNARLFETQQRGLLQNRRLFLESETNLREIERLNRQLTGQSWQEYILERGAEHFGVQLSGPEMQTGPVEITPMMQQAATRHRVISASEDGQQVLAVPVGIRGQIIGVIEVRLNADQNLNEARQVVQAIAERMAFSLENARLFEQAKLSAEREQQINLISSRLQGLTSVEDVLTMAVSTLGQALGAEEGNIRLLALNASTPDAKLSREDFGSSDDYRTQEQQLSDTPG